MKARGQESFKRPQRMRWEYKATEKQVIIIDGEKIILWETEPSQVIVYKKERFVPGNLGCLFFPEKKFLEENFDIEPMPGRKGVRAFRFVPKKENGTVKEILVEFSKEDNLLRQLTFEDALWTKTIIGFEH